MQKITAGLLVLAALAAGCSTTPTALEDARTPRTFQLLKPSLVAKPNDPSNGQSSVVFLRDGGLFGVGCPHDIFVNDEMVLQLGAAETARLLLPPGRTRFRLEIGGIMCPVFLLATEADLKADENVIIRTGIDYGRPFIRVGK